MTTICCVKCPDCKSNPQQSPAPAQPSSLRLIGLPHAGGFAKYTWCHLLRGGGAVAGKSPAWADPSPVPTQATSQEPKRICSLLSHQVNRVAPQINTAHSPPVLPDQHLTSSTSVTNPPQPLDCSSFFINCSVVPSFFHFSQGLASHEKILCHWVPGPAWGGGEEVRLLEFESKHLLCDCESHITSPCLSFLLCKMETVICAKIALSVG